MMSKDHIRKTTIGISIFLIFSVFLSACDNNTPAQFEVQERIPTSRVYINGHVITVDGDFTIAQAFAVNNGRFVAVGSTAEVLEKISSKATVVDLAGQTVMPGFNDNHIHLGPGRRLQEWQGALIPAVEEWTQGASDMEQLRDAFAGKVEVTPEGEWIKGGLTRMDWPNDKVPTRWDLDEMSPSNPVILTRGPHTYLLNSSALQLANIDRNTPDPEGGWIFRDENGEPNGRILEAAKRLVDAVAPDDEVEISYEQGIRDMRTLLTDLMTLGITSVNISGIIPNGIAQVQDLYDRYGEDLPRATMQVRLRPGHDTYDDVEFGIRNEIEALEGIGFHTGFGDDRLKLGAIKMSIDGGLSAPVFWSLEEYKDRPGFHGAIRIPAEVFYPVAKRAHELGWQLGVHTMGDGAVKMVAEQISRILGEQPRDDHRHYMHHVAVKPPQETIELMAENNIMVASQPAFTVGLGAYAKEALTSDRERTQNPTRSLQEAGIMVSHGSDTAPYSPLLTIWTAVTRTGFDGNVYGPEEAVSIEEAIRLHTVAPAYFTFDEDIKGSIEAGKLADFVILSDNILEVPSAQIRNIKVNRVFIDGKEITVN